MLIKQDVQPKRRLLVAAVIESQEKHFEGDIAISNKVTRVVLLNL